MKTIIYRRASSIIGAFISTVLCLGGAVAFSGTASAAVPATVTPFCIALESGHSAIDVVGMPVTGSLYGRAVATVKEDQVNLSGLTRAARIAPSATLGASLNDLGSYFTTIITNLNSEIALHPATVVQQTALNKESAALYKIKDNTSPAYGKEEKLFLATLARLDALNARSIVFDNKAVYADKALMQLQLSLDATPIFYTCRNDKQVVEIARGIAIYANRLAAANSKQGHIARATSYISQSVHAVSFAKVTRLGQSSSWTVTNGIADACLSMPNGPAGKYTVTYGACS